MGKGAEIDDGFAKPEIWFDCANTKVDPWKDREYSAAANPPGPLRPRTTPFVESASRKTHASRVNSLPRLS
jgi:hypothetical protein